MSDLVQPTVFVIEDDQNARREICQFVESMGLNVEEFGSAEDFVHQQDADTAGCIVADLTLGGISGIEMLEQLAETGRAWPMVIITGHATTSTVVRAMRSGAVAVLDKPWNAEELWQAIQEALREDRQRRVKQARIVSLKRRFSLLTDQERMVLRLIVSGYINKQISKQLDVSVRTVESRRQQIFKKTGAKNLGELMWQAMMLRAEGIDTFTKQLGEALDPSKVPQTS